MTTGKGLRLKHIFREDGRAFIVALDHGAIAGAMDHLANPAEVIDSMKGADCLLITRGMLEKGMESVTGPVGVILRISGGFTLLSDPENFEDRIISSVRTALKVGADAVGITVKYGHRKEGEFIEQASRIADTCRDWGMPLMVEVMVQGERMERMGIGRSLSLACRAAFEIGADFIKTSYPGSPQVMRTMVEGCPVPIVVLGGEKQGGRKEIFQLIKSSLDAGGSGVAMGRNIWGDPEPSVMAQAVRRLIHENISIEEAVRCFQTE